MHEATYTKRFSIHPDNHQKALNYLDKWKQDKSNVSDKICRGIEKVGDEEEKGSKLDSFVEEQKKKEEGNQKINEFMILFEKYKSKKLREVYDLEQCQWLNVGLTNFQHEVIETIDYHLRNQKQRVRT